ncbi:MAG: hypothetical protein KF874_01560 [Rhizobiaceae bacterium]|nr:hypothetical protein [Rhizobiaceae bacterium]
MCEGMTRPIAAATLMLMLASPGLAQDFNADALSSSSIPGLPGISGFAPPKQQGTLARVGAFPLILQAKLTEDGSEVTRGMTWRVFRPDPGPDGKLPLIASSQGGSATFELSPGSYLIHAAFGRAGATKRITLAKGGTSEIVVLDAGGLELNAVGPGGSKVHADKLRFSIYEAKQDANGDRPLIAKDVESNTVVRLNAGMYHIVSTYGAINAVVRSDIRVEAGKLTEATVEHSAAEITLKLVRESGGEALADTSWSILTESGDSVTEKVGPYASMVLATGNYTVIAKNREQIYQRNISVEGGKDAELEVLANEQSQIDPGGGD